MDRQPQIVLQRKGRAELERLLADGNTAQKIAKRARIVLMSSDGHGVMAIMREAGVSKTTVWRWREYFVEAGVGGLIKGRTKPPGKKPISAAIKLKIVERTETEHPAAAAACMSLVLEGVASGEILAGEGAALSATINAYVKILEATRKARISALEAREKI